MKNRFYQIALNVNGTVFTTHAPTVRTALKRAVEAWASTIHHTDFGHPLAVTILIVAETARSTVRHLD